MRESLTLKEVAAMLPIDGPGGQLIAMADALHARAGHVQQCLFRLVKLGAARVVWDEAVGSGWWRIPRKRIPNISVRPGATPFKPSDTKGDVGVHEGGVSVKRSPLALTLYGEDPNRPRPKLADIQLVEEVKARVAKHYAADIFARAESYAGGKASELMGVLAIEADALTHAAEMVRARINRLSKEKPPSPGAPMAREDARGAPPSPAFGRGEKMLAG